MQNLKLRLLICLLISIPVQGQKIYQYNNKELNLLFFDKGISHHIPHIVKEYQDGKTRHFQIWSDTSSTFKVQPLTMMFTDWNDDGNGGVSAIPYNILQIGIAPMSFKYNMAPSVERFRHLSSHEETHIVCADKATKGDMAWRKFFGGKVSVNPEYPLSAVWSYMSAPRWYQPRWYHEGIACFMETWLDGGVGRSMGSYNEAFFRTQIASNEELYSVIGLDIEGTTEDFQIGTNSYLYGNRFVDYLAYKYGYDKLIDFYNRTEGSKKHLTKQFKQTYDKKIQNVWDDWREYETQHQLENIKQIEEYPTTNLKQLTKKPLGSASAPIYDSIKNAVYIAAIHPGKVGYIGRLDLNTGKMKRLELIDGPMMYQGAFLTYDQKRDRLIYTTQNSSFRGLKVIDANSGRTLKKKKYQRVSEIVYDSNKDRLYGLMSSRGINHLLYYNHDLEKPNILYTFKFGESVKDLAISSDGAKLIGIINKPDGSQALIQFIIQDLEDLKPGYKELLCIEGVGLNHFRFVENDSLLIGTMDYTGVENIWSFDPKTEDVELLSNVTTALYAPIEVSKDSLIALHYTPDGMQPVKLEKKILEEANSIGFFGQEVLDKNPSLINLDEISTPQEEYTFGDIYNEIRDYNSFKELKFVTAHPQISGYRDDAMFNGTTPVLGYNINFQDRIGINRLNLFVGISPWSTNSWAEKFHFKMDWKFWQLSLDAYYNNTDFYDLFGGYKASRKGYKVGVSYDDFRTLLSPVNFNWGASIATYGMMDALPLFQNITSPVEEMQTASAYFSFSKLRGSIGSVVRESGVQIGASAQSYFATFDGKYRAFPSALIKADFGTLIPIGRNNCFWLRTAVGQSFADQESAFGNAYFGGFRNNIVDNKSPLRYREVYAMPGARIDQIAANTFAKATGEIVFTPIRFKEFGAPGFYPTHAFFSLFSSSLFANPWGRSKYEYYVNLGAQLNIEIVMFSYLKTTLSIGYARMLNNNLNPNGEFMISLKLL